LVLKVRLIGIVAALSVVGVIASGAVASSSGAPPQHIVLIYNGPSIANTHSVPDTPAFASWCSLNGPCGPSVRLPVADAATGAAEGTIYVWTKHFVSSTDGKTTCFGEFIWFALPHGSVYTDSGSNGTCGASIDPSLKPPTHITGAGVVAAGGGDGTIVGGGGSYANWTGTYTDRTFVEESTSGGANYYDQLFFRINPN
jgi:hypothetical protein